MPQPGDVVIADFVGAEGIKRRPAVVVSSRLYHAHRPDIVLAVLTTRPVSLPTPLDYVLTDWAKAGLHQPSTFRSFFSMSLPRDVQVVGRLTEGDWQQVQACLERALSL